MRYFRSAYPEDSFVFILGADSLDYLDRWYDGENLIKENSFLVAVRDFRQGYDVQANIRKIEDMGGKIELIQMPPLDISATYIRATASRGCSVAYLTTPEVEQYIRDKELYR
jgi:nicotinate-nucleotide adenylyltransferase